MEITEEEYRNLLTMAFNRPCQSDSIKEIATAVSNMQKEELFALTDSTNPFFSSKYADISSNWSAARSPLTDNGLSVVQTTEPYPNGITLITTMMHTSGEWIRGWISSEVVPDKHGKRTPQGLLSLITYLRRPGLAAMVGLCPEDDDGESCTNRSEPVPADKKSKKPSNRKNPTALPGNVETDGLGKIKKPGDKHTTELNADEHTMVDYTMTGEDSEAFAHLKEYRPDVVILNKDKTRLKVGKYIVETNADGSKMWADIPKFGSVGFQMDGCVPCLIAAMLHKDSVPFVEGKYGIKFTSEV